MASFLSLVYKRQSSAPPSFHSSSVTKEQQERRLRDATATHLSGSEDSDDSSEDRCLVLPPGVTASGSSETPWPPAMSSSRSEDDGSPVLHSCNTRREEEEEGRRFMNSGEPTLSFTPEGLLPRPSVDRMRQDLQVHPRVLERSLRRTRTTHAAGRRESEALPGVANFLNRSSASISRATMSLTTGFSLVDDRRRWPHGESSILPPPPPSMLMEQEQSLRPMLSNCESSVLSSPPISTSSFYSRRHNDNNNNIAMSPILQVGHARTAVGALVALREAARHQNVHDQQSNGEQPELHQRQSQQQVGSLPLFRKDMYLEALVVTSEGMETPCDKLLNAARDKYDVVDESENLPYCHHRLNDDSPKSASSPACCGNPRHNDDAGKQKTDDSSSLHYASPSSAFAQSRASKHPFFTQFIGEDSLLDDDQDLPSASSSSSSMLRAAQSFRTRNSSTTSLISMNIQEQVTQDEQDEFHEKDRLAVAKKPKPIVEAEASSDNHHDYDIEDAFDDVLMRRKVQNQQRQKQMKLHQHQKSYEEAQDEDDENPSAFQAKLKAELDRCLAIVPVVADEENYSDEDSDYENDEEDEDYYPEEDIEADEPLYDDDRGFDASILHDEEDNMLTFDDALRRRKVRNQRQATEELILQVFSRLRDDMRLVADVDAAANTAVTFLGGWYVKTPMDEPNLMTGFSKEQRQTMLQKIDLILKELREAQPEEYFLSPSQVPVLAVRHDDLHQALTFCRAMINAAVPCAERDDAASIPGNEQKPRFVWKSLPELRHALGIVPPESPAVIRGGDTSLFSLPGESGADTPHTSNVSMGTSITSVNPFSPRHQAQVMRPQLILQQDGLQMRQTIVRVTSLVQKISIACHYLQTLDESKPSTAGARGQTQTYVKACEAVKQNYLQLLAIPKEDTKAVLSSFELELLSPHSVVPLSREVSADEDDKPPVSEVQRRRTYNATSCILPVVNETVAREIAGVRSQFSSLRSLQQARVAREHANIFSPSTQDMRSLSSRGNSDSGVPFLSDDLRRDKGSFDREDGDDELRDPPPIDFETRPGTEEWERMYRNVMLAASSIRSEGNASK